MGFASGQTVLRRYFRLGEEISVVLAGRVISDDERGLMLWIAPGSPHRWRRLTDGRRMRQVAFAEWITLPSELQSGTWEGSGVLMLMPPSGAHSVWWFFQGEGALFSGWYVNLERPVVRWDDGPVAGLDTVDHDLDIVVSPDRSWRWKDEDEILERSAYPEHYWVDDPAAVRAEGERVTKLIESGEFPFDGSWCDYQPDPSWRVPAELPEGWDRPRARG